MLDSRRGRHYGSDVSIFMSFKESRRSLLKAAASVCFDWFDMCLCVNIALFRWGNRLFSHRRYISTRHR